MTAAESGAAIRRPAKARKTATRELLIPAAITAVLLAVLLALGFWQLRRLAWKEAILARIDQAEQAAPVPLPPSPTPFQKVVASGRFLPGPTALYGVEVREGPRGPVMGGQLIQPFETEDGRLLLVDRGWVPSGVRDRPAGSAGAPNRIVGYARPPDRPWIFGAPDDVAGRQFFTLDPARIGAALGLPRVAPFTFVILGPPGEADAPQPAQRLPRPPNNHLSYALTWFGLALALVAVFVGWARKRLHDDIQRL